MPNGSRGSRGKSKGQSNPVRLRTRVLQAPKGFTKSKLGSVLRKSISKGADGEGYGIDEPGLIVELGWSNDGGRTWRYDEWENAMADSATYSRGWDRLMLMYLDMAGV